MAELHVEPQRRSRWIWLWIVIALVIVIGLIWYFASDRGAGLPSVSENTLRGLANDARTWSHLLAV